MKHDHWQFGVWERDELNLPCLRLNPLELPAEGTPWCHLLGNGRLAVLAAADGRLRFLAADAEAPACLTPAGPGEGGAFHLTVTPAGGRPRSLLQCELRADEAPDWRWGIGQVTYAGEPVLDAASGLRLRFHLEAVLPPEHGHLILALTLENPLETPVSLRLAAGCQVRRPAGAPLNPLPAFCRQGVAMVTDVHPAVGDVFMAGGEGWTAGEPVPGWLRLEREVSLPPRRSERLVLLAGVQRDCSLARVLQALAAADPAAARAAWKTRLEQAPKPAELWLREEAQWQTSRWLACRVSSRSAANPLFGADGGELRLGLGGAALAASGPARAAPLTDLLQVCLAVTGEDRALALRTLLAMTARQERSGRLPAWPDQAAALRPDPTRDRGDVELWFLMAWLTLLEAWPEREAAALLELPAAFAEGGVTPLWEHLTQAWRWIRIEIGAGRHGLLRLLAGDWCGWLDRAGREWRGESVVTTAMAVYAAERLARWARHRGDTTAAALFETARDEYRRAVGDAFDARAGWFRRGHADSGAAIGDTGDGRLFLDAQAWAVLACCGTQVQRESALEHALAANGAAAGLALVSPPWPPPPDPALTSRFLPSGEGPNGGVSQAANAWLVWALAATGRREAAIGLVEKMALRARLAEIGASRLPHLQENPWCNGPAAGAREGGPALAVAESATGCPASAPAVWFLFALRRAMA